jgi:hypothetical protein
MSLYAKKLINEITKEIFERYLHFFELVLEQCRYIEDEDD